MSFLSTLRADMDAMGIKGRSVLSMAAAFFLRLDFCAVLLFRAASASHRRGRMGRFFGFVFWRLNVLINGCDIRPEADIGPGLSLPHPMGVVIGPVSTGSRLTVHQNVTMGRARSLDEYAGIKSRPVLGDDVMIYAGAVIVGAVSIGDRATIGANAVVVSDVPEGSTAFAPPARCMPART